ncbi:MAG: hypothetical protein C0601_07890 [Candidatus Muiribacterium halophilum]|uniref:Uncharacterized protein n=1 Tax=Muiribacterium halophilum TaxID=2053465 RepID=A0A2N5ZF99_MUIH1|nr:MAG: hypothetical protein C0601_07890 [Candidatus Muirbacterium halophilum]
MKEDISIETISFLRDYSSDKITFRFPSLPSIKSVYLIYSLDDWNSLNEEKMVLDDEREFFFLTLKSDNNIAYRFKYFTSDSPEVAKWEDNNQKNYYFPKKNISFQKISDINKSVEQVITKGKSILLQYNDKKIEHSVILFPFSNIFFYRTLLDSFEEFQIFDGKDHSQPFIEKKIDNKLTWYLPRDHNTIDDNLSLVLQQCQKNDKIEIGMIFLTKEISGIMKGLETALLLNLDFMIRGEYIVWPEKNS